MAQMRIPKFLHAAHFGMNLHQALPCPPVGVPSLPMAGWMVLFLPVPSPYIYGKFSSQRVETEGMYNTLFGHDWGPLQPHLCIIPPTHVTTPSSVPVNLGSSHKFWMPSYSVKEPITGLVLSNAVRSAVIGLAKTLSRELARDNILINNICPGRIDTERAQKLNKARADRVGRPIEEINNEMAAEVPLGRYGTPEETADVIVFLGSERASYVTGTTIQIDGGLVRGIQ